MTRGHTTGGQRTEGMVRHLTSPALTKEEKHSGHGWQSGPGPSASPFRPSLTATTVSEEYRRSTKDKGFRRRVVPVKLAVSVDLPIHSVASYFSVRKVHPRDSESSGGSRHHCLGPEL